MGLARSDARCIFPHKTRSTILPANQVVYIVLTIVTYVSYFAGDCLFWSRIKVVASVHIEGCDDRRSWLRLAIFFSRSYLGCNETSSDVIP